jgi:hypothetical protein
LNLAIVVVVPESSPIVTNTPAVDSAMRRLRQGALGPVSENCGKRRTRENYSGPPFHFSYLQFLNLIAGKRCEFSAR